MLDCMRRRMAREVFDAPPEQKQKVARQWAERIYTAYQARCTQRPFFPPVILLQGKSLYLCSVDQHGNARYTSDVSRYDGRQTTQQEIEYLESYPTDTEFGHLLGATHE